MNNKYIDLTKDYEAKGTFYLPSNLANQIRGNITFTPEEGVFVTFDGSFWSEIDVFNSKYENPILIIGELDSGKHVTLLNNFVVSVNSILLGGGNIEMKMSVGYMFLGVQASDISELVFNDASIQFDHLQEWLGDIVCTHEYEKDNNKKIHFICEHPQELKFNIIIADHNTEICSGTQISHGGGGFFDGPNIEIRRSLRVKFSDQRLGHKEILGVLETLNN